LQKATILTVDDDANLQIVVRHYLESDGYKVITAVNGDELMDKLESSQADVILLDLVLPDTDGLHLMGKVRRVTTAPIIVVSGKGETTDRIIGLEMGADDYLGKPFEMRELSARIKAVLRRAQTDSDSAVPSADQARSKAEKIVFEGWTLDRTQYQLFDPQNGSASLTTGQFRLLEALMLSPNRALSREYLFELTREGDFDAYDRAIDIQIARIRKKLQDDPKSPAIIKTIRSVGYMFCGNPEFI
jgi:DNA-binding response OmpR family regulator